MPHAHETAAAEHRGLLAVVLAVTIGVFVIEVVGAAAANSLALLADAGHVLTDVAGLTLALAAVWAAGRPANDERTFGYARLEVFAAVGNAVLLLAIAAFVLFEAVQRLSEPVVVREGLMLGIAVIALLANGFSLLMLGGVQRESLNLRGAYLEVLGDTAGSVAVIVAALVIQVTGWTGADFVASVAIGLLILPRTIGLLRDAGRVLMEGTPAGVDLDHVRRHILEAPGVVGCHDLHAWTISSGMNVVSAHVVLAEGADAAVALDALCSCLADDFDIEHSTFQLESEDRRRVEVQAHS